MRFIVLALVTWSLVAVAGAPPAASPAKDEKALIIQNGKTKAMVKAKK